jgi:hypothetical protein
MTSRSERTWRRFSEEDVRYIRAVGRLKRAKLYSMQWKELARRMGCSAQGLKLISQGSRYQWVSDER